MLNQMYKYSVKVNYVAEDPIVGRGVAGSFTGVAGSFTIDVEAQDSFNAKRAAYSEMVDILNEKGYKNYNITVSDVLMLKPEATGAIMKDQNKKEKAHVTDPYTSSKRYKSVTVYYLYKYTIISHMDDELRDVTIEGNYTAKATDYKKGISDTEAILEIIRIIQDYIDHIDNLYSLNLIMTEIKDRSMI